MTDDLEKALKDYQPVFDRPTPVRYDVLHFDDEHRRMDALLRRHYNSFHPLVRDIFTSFSLEFSLLIDKVEQMTQQTEEIKEEMQRRQQILDEGLDDRIQQLTKEKQQLTKEIEEKDLKINELESRVEKMEQILKEKEALIVTQRRQLDLYIENESKLNKEKQYQTDSISQSIEHVNEFTAELENIEQQMYQLEQEKKELQQENKSLKNQISETENQYITEIEEITELYNNLKLEFSSVKETIRSLEKEKKRLEIKLSEEQNTEDYNDLLEENANLQSELKNLLQKLSRKNEEIIQLEEKQKSFKEIAAKLLKFKDQIENQYHEIKQSQSKVTQKDPGDESNTEETKIVHPSDKVMKKKKWTPKKSQLELELEGKKPTKQPVNPEKSFGDMQMIDNDLNLDLSISRITKKLDKADNGNDIIKSIKSSTGDNKDKEDDQITNRLMSELIQPQKNNEDEENEEDIIEKTTNLKRVLERLEGKDLTILDKFAKDFPLPPLEDETLEVKQKQDISEDKKSDEKNSLSLS